MSSTRRQTLGQKAFRTSHAGPRVRLPAQQRRRSAEGGAAWRPRSPRSVELRLTQEATLPVSRPLSELFFAKSEVAFDRFDFCAADKDPVLEFQIAGFFVVFGFRR